MSDTILKDMYEGDSGPEAEPHGGELYLLSV